MKNKVILIIVSVFVVLFVGVVLIYINSTKPLKNAQDAAIERAEKETDLVSVNEVNWFHYLEAYYVIEGTNQDGEAIIVWVPEDDETELTVKKAEDGLSEKEVVRLLESGLGDLPNESRPSEIIDVKLGMLEGVPVYEVTYNDKKNRYSILYIDFYEGEWYRVYNL